MVDRSSETENTDHLTNFLRETLNKNLNFKIDKSPQNNFGYISKSSGLKGNVNLNKTQKSIKNQNKKSLSKQNEIKSMNELPQMAPIQNKLIEFDDQHYNNFYQPSKTDEINQIFHKTQREKTFQKIIQQQKNPINQLQKSMKLIGCMNSNKQINHIDAIMQRSITQFDLKSNQNLAKKNQYSDTSLKSNTSQKLLKNQSNSSKSLKNGNRNLQKGMLDDDFIKMLNMLNIEDQSSEFFKFMNNSSTDFSVNQDSSNIKKSNSRLNQIDLANREIIETSLSQQLQKYALSNLSIPEQQSSLQRNDSKHLKKKQDQKEYLQLKSRNLAIDQQSLNLNGKQIEFYLTKQNIINKSSQSLLFQKSKQRHKVINNLHRFDIYPNQILTQQIQSSSNIAQKKHQENLIKSAVKLSQKSQRIIEKSIQLNNQRSQDGYQDIEQFQKNQESRIEILQQNIKDAIINENGKQPHLSQNISRIKLQKLKVNKESMKIQNNESIQTIEQLDQKYGYTDRLNSMDTNSLSFEDCKINVQKEQDNYINQVHQNEQDQQFKNINIQQNSLNQSEKQDFQKQKVHELTSYIDNLKTAKSNNTKEENKTNIIKSYSNKMIQNKINKIFQLQFQNQMFQNKVMNEQYKSQTSLNQSKLTKNLVNRKSESSRLTGNDSGKQKNINLGKTFQNLHNQIDIQKKLIQKISKKSISLKPTQIEKKNESEQQMNVSQNSSKTDKNIKNKEVIEINQSQYENTKVQNIINQNETLTTIQKSELDKSATFYNQQSINYDKQASQKQDDSKLQKDVKKNIASQNEDDKLVQKVIFTNLFLQNDYKQKQSGNKDLLIVEGKQKDKHVSQRYNKTASPQFIRHKKIENNDFKDFRLILNNDNQDLKILRESVPIQIKDQNAVLGDDVYEENEQNNISKTDGVLNSNLSKEIQQEYFTKNRENKSSLIKNRDITITNIQNSSQRGQERQVLNKTGTLRKNKNFQFEGISKSIQPIFQNQYNLIRNEKTVNNKMTQITSNTSINEMKQYQNNDFKSIKLQQNSNLSSKAEIVKNIIIQEVSPYQNVNDNQQLQQQIQQIIDQNNRGLNNISEKSFQIVNNIGMIMKNQNNEQFPDFQGLSLIQRMLCKKMKSQPDNLIILQVPQNYEKQQFLLPQEKVQNQQVNRNTQKQLNNKKDQPKQKSEIFNQQFLDDINSTLYLQDTNRQNEKNKELFTLNKNNVLIQNELMNIIDSGRESYQKQHIIQPIVSNMKRQATQDVFTLRQETKYRLTQLLNLKINQKWENFEQINSVMYNFNFGKERTKVNDIGSIDQNRNQQNGSQLKDNWREFKKAKKKNIKDMQSVILKNHIHQLSKKKQNKIHQLNKYKSQGFKNSIDSLMISQGNSSIDADSQYQEGREEFVELQNQINEFILHLFSFWSNQKKYINYNVLKNNMMMFGLVPDGIFFENIVNKLIGFNNTKKQNQVKDLENDIATQIAEDLNLWEIEVGIRRSDLLFFDKFFIYKITKKNIFKYKQKHSDLKTLTEISYVSFDFLKEFFRLNEGCEVMQEIIHRLLIQQLQIEKLSKNNQQEISSGYLSQLPIIGTFSTNIQTLKQINESKENEYNQNDLHQMIEHLHSHLLKQIPDDFTEYKTGIYYGHIPIDILFDFLSKQVMAMSGRSPIQCLSISKMIVHGCLQFFDVTCHKNSLDSKDQTVKETHVHPQNTLFQNVNNETPLTLKQIYKIGFISKKTFHKIFDRVILHHCVKNCMKIFNQQNEKFKQLNQDEQRQNGASSQLHQKIREVIQYQSDYLYQVFDSDSNEKQEVKKSKKSQKSVEFIDSDDENTNIKIQTQPNEKLKEIKASSTDAIKLLNECASIQYPDLTIQQVIKHKNQLQAEIQMQMEEKARLRRIDAMRKIVKKAGKKQVDFSKINLFDEDFLKQLGV